LTYPDAPINLSETIAARSATSISFTWDEGAQNGGTPVLDYRVSSDQSSGAYVILAMMVHEKSYTATGLTAGNTYKFKVEARNSYGYSSYSEIATILCATNPSMPLTPTTTVVNDEVIVDWTAPSDQGT
jgi:trimeric autotransporter adhesin